MSKILNVFDDNRVISSCNQCIYKTWIGNCSYHHLGEPETLQLKLFGKSVRSGATTFKDKIPTHCQLKDV